MTTPINPRQLLILDDDWEPPPRPSRLPRFGIALLVIGCIAFVAVRAYVWAQNQGAPTAGRSHPEVGLWYPEDGVEFSAIPPHATPTPPQPQPAPAAPPARLPATSSARAPARPHARLPASPRPSVRQPPPVNPGYLSVNSTPWAVVSLDGRVIGNTPQVRIRVLPGQHALVLAREGFVTLRSSVTVGSGDTVRITGIALKRIAP